ncbi:hypothetical protein F511_08896 [Dorcoceras hygrometricum]|uniref:BI1-like protein n=1 Tax=Dorcoceras hygrometricum TaxID=472368 RepID=A0A2Z7AVL7_9LAMI|nr:hypothetical protein F511_08896 [Dorcoceras hygrometricum]
MAIFYGKSDVELGHAGQLYPGMMENPQMRWGFIRKVYSILCMQLLLAFGVSLAMFLVHPVREFMRTSNGLYVMIAAIILTFVFLIMMFCFSKRHPWDYVILFLFTIALSVMIGAACIQNKGEDVLVSAGLTLVVTLGLTIFTFVAAKRGIVFPMGSLRAQVIGCIGVLVYSGYIIYDTDNLIKRFSYDEYMEAAMCLFLDIINLFLSLLLSMGGDD